MPSAQIGSNGCTFLHQRGVANLRNRVELWVVPGVASVGSRLLGQNDSRFAFEAVFYAAAATVESWYASIAAMQGTVATIIDDWAVTYPGCLIVEVGDLAKTAIVIPGSATNCIGRCMVSGVIVPT